MNQDNHFRCSKCGHGSVEIFNICPRCETPYHNALTFSDCIAGAESIQEKVSRGDYALKTGLSDLDKYMGIFKGELVLISGVPGAGKSSVSHQIALNVARTGKPVLIASYEVSHYDIGVNLICNVAKIDSYMWRMKTLDKKDRESAKKAIVELENMPLFVLDRQPTVTEISETLDKMNELGKPPELLILDYLNIMPTDGRGTKEAIDDNLNGIIAIKNKYGIPVICICAMNRESMKREVQVNKLSDFKDSANIEYGADKAIFLRSDVSLHTKKNEHNTVFVDLVKSRNSPPIIGQLKLKFYPAFHRLENF